MIEQSVELPAEERICPQCGKPPPDIEPFLPWNLTGQRRRELTNRAGGAARLDGL